MLIKAEELADGRWPEILIKAGVDKSYFKLTNGPCPFCGGKDRYRWTNKNGGIYICGQCTASKYRSGFDFLIRHMGYGSFAEAADHVREYFGVNGSATDHAVVQRLAREPKQTAVVDPHKALYRMNRQWSETFAVTAGDPVHQYLTNRVRGLKCVPEEVRYHPALEYWNPPEENGRPPVLLGKFSAMLVRGFDAQDRLVQLHKTYLDSYGNKAEVPCPKKTDQGVGSNSFALRMGQPSDTLGVSEGIETGLASALLRNIPVWPCHSSSILANFELPDVCVGVVKNLIIFADSDEVKCGRKAGEEAAKKLADRARKWGLRTLIMRPAKVGADFSDICS